MGLGILENIDEKKSKMGYHPAEKGNLALLTQVVLLHVLPESLGHLGGRNLLPFPSIQNCGKGGVKLDTVTSKRPFLVYRLVSPP